MPRVIERHHDNIIPLGAIANGVTRDNILFTFDTQAPFVIRGVGGYFVSADVAAGLGGGFIQIEDTERRKLESEPAAVSADIVVSGVNAQYSPYYRQKVWAPGSTCTLTVRNGSGVDWPAAFLILRGARLFYEGQIWSPTYPPCFTSVPFDQSIFPSVAGSGEVRDNIINFDGDGDVAMRGGLVKLISGSIGNLGFRLKDWRENYYSNDYINIRWVFADTKAQRPGVFCPEIYVPANGQMLFDLLQGAASAASFNLDFMGAKVYAGVAPA
jgi:hypothetical protein